MKKVVFTVLTNFVVVLCAFGSDTLYVDISDKWQVYEEGEFKKYSGIGKAVQFTLAENNTGILEIRGKNKFSVFLNNRLVAMNLTTLKWSIDSLMESNLMPLLISMFSPKGMDNMTSQLITVVPDRNLKGGNSSFKHAVIIVSLILIFIILMLIQTYPQAMSGYFNFVNVFSTKKTVEGVATIRITSAHNILLYLFCSLLIGVNLFVYYSKGDNPMKSLSLINYIFKIVSLTAVVMLLLVSKIIINSIAAWIFRLSEFAPGQFYHFVKILLMGFSIASIVLVVNFMLGWGDNSSKSVLDYVIVGMVLVFIVTTYIKLSIQGGITGFNLFSYFCASEIIPLLILLNIFFF